MEREPNDDKLFLFDEPQTGATSAAIVSPIRRHIQQIDEKMSARMSQTQAKKSKSHTSIDDAKARAKRHQRMEFMGISVAPMANENLKLSRADLQTIVTKVSETSMLSRGNFSDKSNSRQWHKSTRRVPEEPKLTPKIPELDCTMEEEHARADRFAPSIQTQASGTNAKLFRADKAEQDEWNAKLDEGARDGKTFAKGSEEVRVKAKPSAMKKLFSEIIASKLRAFGGLASDERIEIDEKIQSSVESMPSLLSSDESGSFLEPIDREVSKSQKKFQVSNSIQLQTFPHHSTFISEPKLGDDAQSSTAGARVIFRATNSTVQ